MSLFTITHSRAMRRRSFKNNYKIRRQMVSGRSASALLQRFLAWLSLQLQLLLNQLIFLLSDLWEIIRLLPRWIAEQFYFCPLRRPKSAPSPDFLITGHRGAPAHQAENTLESLALALEHGANALEVDLCITKDEQIIVWHDWDPDSAVSIVRQLGLEPAVKCRPFVPMQGDMRRPVPQLTLDEFREHYGYCKRKRHPVKLEYRIPTLPELLQWATAQVQLQALFLDVKIPRDGEGYAEILITALQRLVRELQPAFQIVLLSPHGNILRRLKTGLQEMDFSFDVILPQVIVIDPQEFSAVLEARKFGNHIASVGRPAAIGLAPWTTYRRVIEYDRKLMREMSDPHGSVDTLIGWTINRRREMKCLLRHGISGLMTDYPGRLANIYRRHHGK